MPNFCYICGSSSVSCQPSGDELLVAESTVLLLIAIDTKMPFLFPSLMQTVQLAHCVWRCCAHGLFLSVIFSFLVLCFVRCIWRFCLNLKIWHCWLLRPLSQMSGKLAKPKFCSCTWIICIYGPWFWSFLFSYWSGINHRCVHPVASTAEEWTVRLMLCLLIEVFLSLGMRYLIFCWLNSGDISCEKNLTRHSVVSLFACLLSLW